MIIREYEQLEEIVKLASSPLPERPDGIVAVAKFSSATLDACKATEAEYERLARDNPATIFLRCFQEYDNSHILIGKANIQNWPTFDIFYQGTNTERHTQSVSPAGGCFGVCPVLLVRVSSGILICFFGAVYVLLHTTKLCRTHYLFTFTYSTLNTNNDDDDIQNKQHERKSGGTCRIVQSRRTPGSTGTVSIPEYQAGSVFGNGRKCVGRPRCQSRHECNPPNHSSIYSRIRLEQCERIL